MSTVLPSMQFEAASLMFVEDMAAVPTRATLVVDVQTRTSRMEMKSEADVS